MSDMLTIELDSTLAQDVERQAAKIHTTVAGLAISPLKTQEDIDALASEIYRDSVLRARAEDPCEKLMDGFRLFESSLAFMKMGVEAEIGSSDPEAIMQGVQKRFDTVRKMREHGLYQPWSPPE